MTDYTKLVKALRCKRDDCEGCGLAFFDKDEGWICQYAAKDDDAADAIAELQDTVQAQDKALKECAEQLANSTPKRGEWIKESYNNQHNLYRCSVCGLEMLTNPDYAKKHKFCFGCGAKMGVQK